VAEETGAGKVVRAKLPSSLATEASLTLFPLAGIPFEKAREIHLRHVDELSDLPGVIGVGLGAEGIHVTTHNPEVVPKEVEGVPIIVESAAGVSFEPSSHTFNQ